MKGDDAASHACDRSVGEEEDDPFSDSSKLRNVALMHSLWLTARPNLHRSSRMLDTRTMPTIPCVGTFARWILYTGESQLQ